MAAVAFSPSPACRAGTPGSDDRARVAPPRVSASAPKLPRNFSLRSSAPSQPAAVTATAAPPSTPPSIEERRKIAQEAQEKTPFVITEVDAAEQKDFYDAPVLSVMEVAPGVRCVTVQAEISREFVPLARAYTKPGQAVRVRIPSGAGDELVPVSSAAFSGQSNFGVLYKLRGDIPAGSTKAPQFALSVRCPMDLHVSEAAHPALFNLAPGDTVEVGQFEQCGMDLRPIMFLSRFPTILLFASGSGAGISTVRALIEAEDVGSLYLGLREDVRLYYAAASPQHLAYQDRFPTWEKLNVKVKPVVAEKGSGDYQGMVGTFASAFDEDDLEYDPETTGAVVCGDEKSNAAALAVLDDAGIPRSSIIVWTTPSP